MTTINSAVSAPHWMHNTPALASMTQTVPPGRPFTEGAMPTWSGRFEGPLTLDSALGLLNPFVYGAVTERLRELQPVDSHSQPMAEGSVVAFSSMLAQAGWQPPTHIGLTETGAVSASWRNEPVEGSPDNIAYDGSVVVVFPSDDELYEITAMYGTPSLESEWIQVVGNLEAKKAAGLLDQILQGFHS